MLATPRSEPRLLCWAAFAPGWRFAHGFSENETGRGSCGSGASFVARGADQGFSAPDMVCNFFYVLAWAIASTTTRQAVLRELGPTCLGTTEDGPRPELTIAIAQTNPTVGDVAGNLARIRAVRAHAAAAGADLVVFSELVVVGYPPEDLVLKPAFQEAAAPRSRAAGENRGRRPGADRRRPWATAAASTTPCCCWSADGSSTARYKHDLPNYGVFDEKRVFAAGRCRGRWRSRPRRPPRLGGMVCEDMWYRRRGRGPRRIRRRDPDRAERLAVRARQAGRAPQSRGRAGHRDRPAADLLQPGRRPGRAGVRRRVVRAQRRWPLVAQAGLRGRPAAHDLAPRRRRRLALRRGRRPERRGARGDLPRDVLGLRDYVDKNRFPAWCWASPAASIRRCRRRSRSMRWAPSGCTR